MRQAAPFRLLPWAKRASFAWLMGMLGALAALLAGTGAALANCAPVAWAPPPGRIVLAATIPEGLPPRGSVELTFLGHATFLVRTPGGVTAVTDYNDYVRAPFTPDIATMNLAHDTHYSRSPEPGIRHLLPGWKEGGVIEHNLVHGDLRVFSVPTNIRDWGSGATRYAGNSIFVFEAEGLCIAHLSHLHHTLTEQHLRQLGPIDVLLVPIDGLYTMPQPRALEIIEQIKPKVVVPMHYFSTTTIDQFLQLTGERWKVRRSETPTVLFARATLPDREILILPGY